MSCKLEPAIWPRDTGQRIPCFDRCQLIVALMSDINEVHSKPRLYVSANLFWSMAAMLRDSVAAVVVVRTRPRAIPLAMITMRKSTHGFPFLSYDSYGAPLGGPSGRRSSANSVILFSVFISHMIKLKIVIVQ